MCGICGYVDFRAPDIVRRDAETLLAMTETLISRGPDDGGTWLGEYAGLGHRRLSVLDPEHSRQPMIEETTDGPVVLSFSGEIYNFGELRTVLEADGHRFMTDGDTEVLLRAYLNWGESCVDRLIGMFAFAVWDGRRRRLLLVRDRLGIKPLYYYTFEGRLLFGSEPKAILAHPLVEPVVDADGLRQIFSLVRAPGDAVFRGMREVRPGHCLVADATGVRERCYWTLESRPHSDSLADTVHTVRSMLREIVAMQLVSDVPIGTMLSGGLDSSLLTALAADVNRRHRRPPVRSFSVGFEGGGFEADAIRPSEDDPFVDIAVEAIATEHRCVRLPADSLFDPAVRRRILEARDLPTLGEIDASLYLLFAAVAPHATVVLSGEGADELFGGYRWFHDPSIVAEAAFPWLAQARSLGRYSMFEPGGVSLDVRDYQADLYNSAIRQVPKLDGETDDEARMRQIRFLHLAYFLSTPLERKDRLSMAVGLEVRVPYADHRLVEYAFNIPWSMSAEDGQEKSLLRAAAAGMLPESIARREKNPFPATQDPAYDAMLRAEVLEILSERRSPALELFRPSTVRALASIPPDRARAARLGLERFLSVHDWLTTYGVSIAA